ncbi:MAG: disulfide bond formation protein DsbA [Actinobacteria bacterium HGW-Actinobacteria-4]|nr:MAG: disulfide bond formation protein DsbA [Actinobacteria bacterium HGW-Actinobacteria-4]
MAKSTTKNADTSAAAQARAKAQEQLRAQERKTRVVIWASVIIGIVLAGGLAAFIMSQSQSGGEAIPAGATEAGGIPVGMSGVVGEDLPEGVPVVRVYADYLCPVCGELERIVGSDLDELREAGTIRLEYHPVSILDRASPTQYASRAANAVATVADGSPEHFLAYSHVLFENQPREGVAHPTNAQLAALAVGVGVPQEVADTIGAGTFRGWVVSATQQASIEGLQGTPTIMVDGQIISQNEVPYFQPGALRAFLEALASQA